MGFVLPDPFLGMIVFNTWGVAIGNIIYLTEINRFFLFYPAIILFGVAKLITFNSGLRPTVLLFDAAALVFSNNLKFL